MSRAGPGATASAQPAAEGRPGPWPAIVESGALALLIGAGLAGWWVGIATRGYDYDEVQRAHSVWLASLGLRPYSDFFECHPPYFALLAPLLRLDPDPVAFLRALRLAAGVGHLLFLGGLVVLAAMGVRPGTERRWAWLGVAAVAFAPPILDFLVEFRIDGWGYALAVWSVVLFRRRPRGFYRALEFGALSGVAAALFCPKLVLLPPLVVLFDLVANPGPWRAALRTSAGYLAGVALAALAFGLYLAADRIGLRATSLLLGRYHAVSNAHAGFRYGLLGRIVALWPLNLVVLAGAAGWAGRCLLRRTRPGPYELAVAAWLAMQAALVSYPYKQYYAPWFLFGSSLVALLGPVAAALPRVARVAAFVAACLLAIPGPCQIARGWARFDRARADESLIRWMTAVAPVGERVVGSPPYHPIVRHDAFFLWFNTSDPNGFDSEEILAALPGLRRFVTREHYRAELEAHPPALVVLQSPLFEVVYPEVQRAVLFEFLRRRGYRPARVGVVSFAVRPDRYDDARRRGLLD